MKINEIHSFIWQAFGKLQKPKILNVNSILRIAKSFMDRLRNVGNNTERGGGGESILSDQYNFSLSILRFICDATSIYPVNI